MKRREKVWAKESERRIDALETGKLSAHDAKSVLAGLRKGLKSQANPKTSGEKLVENYRPRMSRLSVAQRQKLMACGIRRNKGSAL